MPVFERGDVRIAYEVRGPKGGFPLLLIAPGGMRSARRFWPASPWNPLAQLSTDFRVIAMDQRNAGESTAPVSALDGWSTYTADQLGLMDHLGVDSFVVVGMCIGGPYIMGLHQAAPQRVRAAIMMQPIGVDDNRTSFLKMFDAWAEGIAEHHPEADAATWAAFRAAMFGGDFMFNTSREVVAACQMPILLLRGDDHYHPASISDDVAKLAPNVTYIDTWKQESLVEQTQTAVLDFLRRHTA